MPHEILFTLLDELQTTKKDEHARIESNFQISKQLSRLNPLSLSKTTDKEKWSFSFAVNVKQFLN